MSHDADGRFQRLFKASSEKILVLQPATFEILAVTDAYLTATRTRESDLVGKRLLDIFPDDPEESQPDGARNLLFSLRRAQLLKEPDVMGVQRYPIRLPDGTFEERFWSPVNSPLLDDTGEVELILHRVEDVTAIVRESGGESASEAGSESERLELREIVQRSRELKQALSKLQDQDARMRVAERMLNLGTWEYYPETGALNWSRQVFDIYDLPADEPGPDFEKYFERVHPDDREASRAAYAMFSQGNVPLIEFEHRVIARDGSVRYIKGVGERQASFGKEIVVGYFLDITPLIRMRHKLSLAEQVLKLAGEKARLGGWRVDLDSETIIWTEETSLIHGMPPGYSPPSVQEATQFYAPEYRGLILDVFSRCARDGEEFDVTCQLLTEDGGRPWVRVIGVPDRDASGRIFSVQGAFQDVSKLHEAQQLAVEADQQRNDVLESISDAFFAIDEHWNFTYINQQACILLDRTREELLGRHIWDVYPDEVGSEFQRQYLSALESGEAKRFQAYFGLGLWLDVTAYPMARGLTVYFRDVTSDRVHQERLRLIDAALSRQNDIVMITDADTLDAPDGPRIVYVNDAFERLTGYSAAEVIGKTPRLLQGQGSDRGELEKIRQALLNKASVRSEVLNYHKLGHSYWLELDITPLFDQAGHCTHFVAVERDITQRKQQEADLIQAQERFQLISRASNDVVWDWDLAADVIWWGDSMLTVFGYELSELEPGGASWTNRIHPDDLERVVGSFSNALRGHAQTWEAEYRFLKHDGQIAIVIDRGFFLRNSSGKAIRMVGSMLDITERTELEGRLRESQKLEAVGHLTGGIAHDFNNLLTVILGNAEMLTEMLTDTQTRSLAEMTLLAGQRGAELTSRLLAFSRRQALDPKLTDINQVVEQMQALLRLSLPANIELEFVAGRDLWTTEIDTTELDAALLNLVVNAGDAMGDGGKLTVETRNIVLDDYYADRHPDVIAGEYVMVCVSDTGTGMDPETLRLAVEPFFTTKEVGKGSGLGLSMVFGFTKQSGGHINIYSELNEGTSVKLYFPRARGEHTPSYQPVGKATPLGGGEHILIAEDDPLVLEHLERQLQALGYRVTAAASGPEAVDILQTQSDIDLLLTDIIMPGGMNGRELADRAQALKPALKILFMSGYSQNAIVHQGRLDAGVDLLSKPYTRMELADKVRQVLDRESTVEA